MILCSHHHNYTLCIILFTAADVSVSVSFEDQSGGGILTNGQGQFEWTVAQVKFTLEFINYLGTVLFLVYCIYTIKCACM